MLNHSNPSMEVIAGRGLTYRLLVASNLTVTNGEGLRSNLLHFKMEQGKLCVFCIKDIQQYNKFRLSLMLLTWKA
jgi:hypothetical protein